MHSFLQALKAESPLNPGELALLELMATELAHLPIERRSDGSRVLGALGHDAAAHAAQVNRLGAAAYQAGITHVASAAFSLALRCRLRVSPIEDRETLTILRHWGLARREDGEYEEALSTLQFVQTHLVDAGESDFESLDNRNDIAITLLDLGKIGAAMEILRPLVDANKRARPGRGKDPRTLVAESNLADAMKMAGDDRGAFRLVQRVMRDRSASPELGPDHPDTLTSANNAAELMQRLGDLRGALRLQEQTLARRRATMPDHPDTVTAMANLATTLYALGQFPQALVLEREVLHERRERDGRSHPNTLIAANNLAGTLRDLGHFTEAMQLLRQVVRDHGVSVRSDSPEALMALTNLADLLRELGDMPGAGRLARRAWRLREAAFGAEHPDTVTSMASYAAVLHGRSQHGPAAKLQRHILAIRQRDHGANHPLALQAECDLANMLSKLGQHARACALYSTLAPRTAAALGAGHPDALEVRLSLAEALYDTGDRRTATTHAKRISSQILSRRFLDARDFDRCARVAGLLLMLDAHTTLEEFLGHVSSMMWDTLELLDQESSRRLLADFTALHDTWVRHCLTHMKDDILRALAPLHGLEAAAWVRADVDRQLGHAGSAVNVRQRYGDTRRQLHGARIQLTTLDAEILAINVYLAAQGSASGPLRLQRRQLLKQREEAVAIEKAAMEALSKARDDLYRAEPGLQVSQRLRLPATSELRSWLDATEAVVLLAHFSDGQAAAVTLRRTGSAIVPLPAVPALAEAFSASERPRLAGLRAPGMRGQADEAAANDGNTATAARHAPPSQEPLDLSALEQAASAALWAPLAGALSGVTRLHVVLAPTLRGLPVQSGCPIRHTGCYAALPGFLRVHEESRRAFRRPASGTVRLDIGFDCAWMTPVPIPFVRAEVELLRAVGASVRVQNGLQAFERLHSGDHAPSMQIACHGTTAGQGTDRFAVLLLDVESGTRLDPRALLSMPGSIDEFVCSTCVGGVVSQGVGADAIGIVSVLQLKGAHSVVACLAPVSDFHMPLLMAMYSHHRASGFAAAAALELAKTALRTGEWPAEVVALAPAAYGAAMQEVLRRAQYAGTPTGNPNAAADRAFRLAGSVGGWILPTASLAQIGGGSRLSGESHLAFSRSVCETSRSREQFATRAAEHMVETRMQWPTLHRALVEHLCAFTQCYGGVDA